MSQISKYLGAKLLDHSLGTSTFTFPIHVYIALFSNTIDRNNTGTEIPLTTGYQRQLIHFGPTDYSTGQATNSSIVEFNSNSNGFGLVANYGIFDSVTSGNLLYFAPIPAPINQPNGFFIGPNENFLFPVGGVKIVMA